MYMSPFSLIGLAPLVIVGGSRNGGSSGFAFSRHFGKGRLKAGGHGHRILGRVGRGGRYSCYCLFIVGLGYIVLK